MNPVETYICSHSENQQKIMMLFHDMFTNQHQLKAQIKWKIPTYFGKAWVFYMNPDKKSSGVHLCFLRGDELSKKHSIVKFEGRKMVKSILISDLETIPYDLLMECITEAIQIDQTIKYIAPNKRN